MPAKTAKQYRFMQLARTRPDIGPSREVAEEFIRKTPKGKRRLFMRGRNAQASR